jgi:hypothetical protein
MRRRKARRVGNEPRSSWATRSSRRDPADNNTVLPPLLLVAKARRRFRLWVLRDPFAAGMSSAPARSCSAFARISMFHRAPIAEARPAEQPFVLNCSYRPVLAPGFVAAESWPARHTLITTSRPSSKDRLHLSATNQISPSLSRSQSGLRVLAPQRAQRIRYWKPPSTE